MLQRKIPVALFALLVAVALTAQVGAVPGVTAQQETPTETPGEETETETPGEETETETPGEETETETPGEENETNQTASVTFEDQETEGQTVTVSNVTLTEPGYVVIHDERLQSDQTVSSVIGTSEYLPAGEYNNVTITLFDVPGVDFEEEANQTGVGFGTETPTPDGETPTPDGETPTDSGALTPDDETPTETATPDDETPTPDDETPTETATPDGETPTPDGEAEADNETDNETAAEIRLTSDQNLTAMVHAENSNNQSFDFVRTVGLNDGPVLVDDEPVTDTANVTVVEEINETETPGEETETETPGEETETETPGEETETETPG